jgi:5'-3' exonuclease
MSKTFQQVSEQENSLIVVDALNLAFRWKHSDAINFAEDYKRTIESLKKSYKAKWVVIAADQGSSSYRKALYPEYKQNRKDKFAEQTEAEKAAFELFFEDYQASLDNIRETTDYPVIQFKQTEADDIAAYITSIRNLLPAVDHIWLISSDKDWDLLIGDKVSRFSYVTRKEITANNWHTHYSFPHEHYISVKCLMGDTGDNVLGVEGIGPKRAQQLVEEYGTALDIVAELPIQSKLKYIKTLNQSGDRILLNYQLMDLISFCQDALGENCKQIDEILKDYCKD